MDPLRVQIETIIMEVLERVGMLPKQEVDYLATRQAAAIAGVSTGTIRRWMSEGRLRAFGAGRELRVDRAELLALMQNGRAERPRPNPPARGNMSPEACAAREDAREAAERVARLQHRVVRTPKRKVSGT